MEMLLDQIKAVEAERDAMLADEQQSAREVVMLTKVVGIGPEFAAVLWGEGLFRHFDNRRQVAAYAGLAPTPWQSGSVLEMAWLWLRHQPASELSRWFNERVAQNGGRFKKVMITALARKLVVALWKYVTAGVLIEGARVRP